MNKSQLIAALSVRCKLSNRDAEKVVEIFFKSIARGLKRNERTELRGFGSFKVKSYKAYLGRNPKSGTSVLVKAKKLPFFKAGKDLKTIINTKPTDRKRKKVKPKK
jgi:integration host factor subunit beta